MGGGASSALGSLPESMDEVTRRAMPFAHTFIL
jgi:hypothetical protein